MSTPNTEPMFEIAEFSSFELFSPVVDETLWFFKDLLGMIETGRQRGFGLPARLAGSVQPLAEDHLPGPAGYGIGGLAGDVTACPGTSGEGRRVHRTGSRLGRR